MVDALRLDFVEWDVEAGETRARQLYTNRMEYLHGLLSGSSPKCHLRPFVADPPTTTMQRLKALCTGGGLLVSLVYCIPNSIDVLDSLF